MYLVLPISHEPFCSLLVIWGIGQWTAGYCHVLPARPLGFEKRGRPAFLHLTAWQRCCQICQQFFPGRDLMADQKTQNFLQKMKDRFLPGRILRIPPVSWPCCVEKWPCDDLGQHTGALQSLEDDHISVYIYTLHTYIYIYIYIQK